MLRELGGPAERHQRRHRHEFPVARREFAAAVDVAVDDLDDHAAQVAQSLDGGERLLVVDLQEPRSAAFVPIVVVQGWTLPSRVGPVLR